MNKKIAMFFVLVVAFALLVIPTASFAGGTGEVSTENTFIAEGAASSKASPLIFKFDPNTEFKVGDQMEFALTNHATLAKKIDMIVGDNTLLATPYTSLTFCDDSSGDGTLVLPDQSSKTSPLVTSGSLAVTATNGGVCFKIKGDQGQDKIMMTVLGTPKTAGSDGSLVAINGTSSESSQGTMKLTSATQGNLLLRIFDLEIYTGQHKSIYLKTPGQDEKSPNIGYNTQIINSNDNAICIDVSAKNSGGDYWAQSGTNIDMNVDAGGQYTFNNAPYAVAYITGSDSLVQYKSNKLETGFIPIGVAASQTGSGTTCKPFYNDKGLFKAYASEADGFCKDTHRANKFMLRSKTGSAISSTKQYKVRLTIVVDGATGTNGVYWASTDGNVPSVATDSNADLAQLVSDPTADFASGVFKAYRYNGTDKVEVTNADFINATNRTICTVPANSRAVILETSTYHTWGLRQGTDTALWIAIPPMVYDTSLFMKGKKVGVKVEILEAPCGTVFSGIMDIATGTDSCGTSSSSAGGSLLFPYFPNPADGILDIMYIVNNSTTAGEATIIAYEQDGDAFQAKVNIPAHGIKEINYLASSALFTRIAGSGTLGDKPFYAFVTTKFATGGATLIYQVSTGLAASYDVVQK